MIKLMYYYAELDSNDICVGVFESLDVIEDTSYIEIDSLDDTLIGLHYDRTTGQWEEAVTFAHSTDDIKYRNSNTSLSDVLDSCNKFTVNVLGDSSI